MKVNHNVLFPAKKDGKSGYINYKGQVVIDFRFDFFGSREFSEGLASVLVNDKAGFIDAEGNFVIEPKFDMALNFSEGLALVQYKGKYCYIDRKGDFIIQSSFYRCDSFENGLAFVVENIKSKGNFIDQKGNKLFRDRNFLISQFREGLINCPDKSGWGFIDINDNFVIEPIYKSTRPFYENKAAVVPKKNLNGKPNRKDLFGFINLANEMIIDPIFQGADARFSEGLCLIHDNGYGYINDLGEIEIPCDFYYGGHFLEGMAVIKPKGRNKKYGFIDRKGNVIIEPVFTHAEEFKNGLSAIVVGREYKDFKYGYINKNGDTIWEPKR